jgi:XapX domain-containing protein
LLLWGLAHIAAQRPVDARQEEWERRRESPIMSNQTVSASALTLAFGTGLAVGIVFSLVKLPSPAPPFLGLIGPVGMFMGQRLWPFLASRFFHH